MTVAGPPRRLRQQQRAWEDLARADPFWAMTGDHKFGQWKIEDLLTTGDTSVAELLNVLDEFHLPRRRRAVLDFGCGVGRLTRAFRSRFDQYYGVDISEGMLRIARAVHANVSGCLFVASSADVVPLADHAFDLVYCFGVLQHVDERAAAQYIREFLRILRPDGAAVFQVFDGIKRQYRLQPRRRIYGALRYLGFDSDLLYARLGLYPQAVYTTSQECTSRVLSECGARVLLARRTSAPGAIHSSITYYVTSQNN